MPTWKIVVMVVAFICIDAMILVTVFWAVGRSLGDFAMRFPARPPEEGAVRREFQSIHLNYVGLGNSVHLTADASHLHIDPAKFGRLIGMRSMSLPWDIVKVKKRGRWRTSADVGGSSLVAPNWCMDLANPAWPDRDSLR